MRKYLVLSILLGQKIAIIFPCLAEVPRLMPFDDYVTQIYQRQNFTEEEDFESIKEALQEAYASPLNLNKVTKEALASLGILSENQIENYFKHLAATGPLYSKYELQAIPDFDLETITLLLPFVQLPESYHTSLPTLPMARDKNNYFLFRYEPSLRPTSQSSPLKPALGNLDKYTAQLSLKYPPTLTLGITARKQAGESFCLEHATHRYGFNLWSIFIAIEPKKYFQRIVIGDYQIGYGQGLLLGAGYTIPKGADIVSIIRSNNIGIRAYKGIRRIGLRGIALTTSALGPITLTGFYANHNLDASIKLDAHNRPYTHHIDRIGKYDTLHKLQKKGTIHEQVIGSTVLMQFHKKQTEVGLTLLYHHYDTPIMPKKNSGYLFQGQYAIATSLFYRLLWKNIVCFGEGSIVLPDATIIGQRYEKALITGAIISLSRYFDLSTAIYHYGKAFFSPYGHSFKHYSTDNANEKGFYGGITITPVASWQLTISGHFFATLRPKPQLAAASSGFCFTTRSSYTWNRATLLVIQHKLNKTPKHRPKSIRTTATIASANKNSLKLKLDHKLTHTWWTNIEAQYTHHTFLERTHQGYTLSSTQKWKGNLLQYSSKITYFQANHYVNRCYFYEPSLLHSGTQFRPYYGHGIAITFAIQWKPIKSMYLALKYGYTPMFKEIKLAKKTDAPTKAKHLAALQIVFDF